MGSEAPASDDEDDYLNMTFDDPPPKKETSLQRTQRLKKESMARGVIKSKAQIAEDEALVRQKALSTSILDAPDAKKSKGFAMMAKMGFKGGGLGKKAEDGEAVGRAEPIQLNIKEDRGGIGLESEKKRKFDEVMAERGVKTARVEVDPLEYRDRVRKEREDARLEAQVHSAQRLAEQMDEEQQINADGVSSRPLKSIPVLYRGLVRHREEKERDRRMRYDLEQSLSRMPTYQDDDEDEDDQKALGKKKTEYVAAEDLDEEDEELDEFNALEVGQRLRKLVEHLRSTHWYCFWCKMKYDDESLEGCPGITEEDHD